MALQINLKKFNIIKSKSINLGQTPMPNRGIEHPIQRIISKRLMSQNGMTDANRRRMLSRDMGNIRKHQTN
jgi:hypothetical protein